MRCPKVWEKYFEFIKTNKHLHESVLCFSNKLFLRRTFIWRKKKRIGLNNVTTKDKVGVIRQKSKLRSSITFLSQIFQSTSFFFLKHTKHKYHPAHLELNFHTHSSTNVFPCIRMSIFIRFLQKKIPCDTKKISWKSLVWKTSLFFFSYLIIPQSSRKLRGVFPHRKIEKILFYLSHRELIESVSAKISNKKR